MALWSHYLSLSFQKQGLGSSSRAGRSLAPLLHILPAKQSLAKTFLEMRQASLDTEHFFWSHGAGPPPYPHPTPRYPGKYIQYVTFRTTNPTAMQVAGLLDSSSYENHFHSPPYSQFEKSIFTV